ncbi:A49-like RNA polymerase I associated factor [Teladorsagia circumcincta]|uniref:A49-like RNA polymerase I associated factor n=1 Tax=Teladorsagia circumcincta TaxID=45464 RepID=A0A2G9UM23_TELCI|nr:A49-like RNA polymerase I associated factor [Teladorsagia circumcincta]
MLKTEAEKHRHEREKLKRKSAAGRSDHDIVACFSHNRLIDATKASFQEHRSIDGRRGEPVYTIKTDICENVVEIGKEVSSIDDGYDYAVAIVDRETGTTTYRPIRLYNFQATYSSDIPQLIGEKRSAPIDYSASYDIKTEEWAKKRMDLTADFGSSKKMKIQEASIRRQINTETLDAMRKTAFASTSVLADTEDIKQEQISLVVKAESAILPHARPAELPRNIYPISTFITEEEQQLLSASAVEFLSSSKKELLEKGFPEVVVKMLPSSVTSDASRAVAFTLLGCMTYMANLFAQRSVLKSDFDKTPFPSEFVEKIMADFISSQWDRGPNGRTAARLAVSTDEKDKLIAHLLALGLTLSAACSLPITPWQNALKRSSRFLEKIFVGLGCTIVQCTVEEAARTESLRAARLLRPPSKDGPL